MKATLLAACLFLCYDSAAAQRIRVVQPPVATNVTDLATFRALSKTSERIQSLHHKMADPKEGDWLFKFKNIERGQSFQQYLKVRPQGLGTDRKVIYVTLLGALTADQTAILCETAEFLSIFYGMKIQWRDPLPANVVPNDKRRLNPNSGATQFDSIHIIRNILPPRVPSDAAALIALTATDLWPDDESKLNFVFGQALLGSPTCVCSLQRLGNAEQEAEKPLVLLRMIKIVTHETGHCFGIPHCRAYECGMDGSNGLSETDRHPLAFCPECEAKVWLVSGADPAHRYRELASFAKRHGLHPEEDFWTKSAEGLEGAK